MYILTRYVVTEVLKFFLVTLLGLTLIVTVVMGVKQGLSQGLPPMVMLYVMPYMLPEMLGITIPVSLLLAVSIVYGRMTGTNEVVALKSLGINPMVIVWPVIIFAFLLSLGTIWMQEIAATWCRPSYARVAAESVEEIAYGMLQTNHSIGPPYTPQFSITVKRVDGRNLIQPTITIFRDESHPTTTVRAMEAELRTDRQRHEINIVCRNFDVDIDGKYQFSDPGEWSQSLPIVNPGRNPGVLEHHRDWVAMYEIPEHIAKLKAEVFPLEQKRADLEASGKTLPQADSARLSDLWRLIYRLQTEPYRRLSNGFTCLCFVLIGVPVAMLWRHADVLTNFFVCFVPILAVYYPLLMLSEDLSTSGKLWPISFWMSNTVCIASGILLLRRIVQH
ncbi:MAG: LptF/LptG family permease [Thermoguttaceae bacterium]|jgi:lipopolysaccharide export system permease protein